MKSIKLITQSDDLGTCHSANVAIAQAAEAGFIKNVSVLATGGEIEEAAQMLKNNQNVLFGLHATINSEFEALSWGPVLPIEKVPSLVTQDGHLRRTTQEFFVNKPNLEEIDLELQAQFDKLKTLGFRIAYADFHMAPGRFVPGLDCCMQEFCRRNGIQNHGVYGITGCYPILPLFDEISTLEGEFERVLSQLPSGQYFYLGHPAVFSKETLACGPFHAYKRNADYTFACSPATLELCKKYGVETVRYDNADPTIVSVL